MQSAQSLFAIGEMGKDRIEALSDGVFAIIVTLLVLEFRVPEPGEASGTATLLHALRDLLPVGLSYVLSFLFVTIYWINHHQLLALLHRADRGLLWSNSLFLMLMAFIPFPTALIGRYHTEPVAVAFFGLAMTAVGLSFTLLRWYVSRTAGLLNQRIAPELLGSALRRSALGPVLYLTGALLALLSTWAALALYVIIPILYILPGRLDRHRLAEGEAGDIA